MYFFTFECDILIRSIYTAEGYVVVAAKLVTFQLFIFDLTFLEMLDKRRTMCHVNCKESWHDICEYSTLKFKKQIKTMLSGG